MTDQPKIPKLPKAVEDFADTVLRYRPKPKSEPAKSAGDGRRRSRRADNGMLVPPFISFDAIGREELNSCLVAWGHKMGPWHRPNYGCEVFHGLCHNGELVAVTAAARMIPEATAGLSRDEAFELGRVCAARRDLNRAT